MVDRIRIVFLADSHLGFDYPLRPRIERRRRGDDFFANFRRVLDYAAASKPDMVVHGGDLFFRSRVPAKIVDMVYADLAAFAKTGIPSFVVPGNHERSALPPSLWLAQPNVYLFDRPTTFHLSVAGHTVGVSGFPFLRGVQPGFADALNETGWQGGEPDVRILCMHQAVEGATVGPGSFTFRAGPDVVRLSHIPADFAVVLSGHIHRRQILYGRGTKRPLIYAGAIERTSFAEKDEPKGFYEIELRPDRGRWAAQSIRFLDLPSRPMVDIRIDKGLKAGALRSYLRQSIARLDENAIVRLSGIGEGNGAGELTAGFVRSVFPPSVTVELSQSLYRNGHPVALAPQGPDDRAQDEADAEAERQEHDD